MLQLYFIFRFVVTPSLLLFLSFSLLLLFLCFSLLSCSSSSSSAALSQLMSQCCFFQIPQLRRSLLFLALAPREEADPLRSFQYQTGAPLLSPGIRQSPLEVSFFPKRVRSSPFITSSLNCQREEYSLCSSCSSSSSRRQPNISAAAASQQAQCVYSINSLSQ